MHEDRQFVKRSRQAPRSPLLPAPVPPIVPSRPVQRSSPAHHRFDPRPQRQTRPFPAIDVSTRRAVSRYTGYRRPSAPSAIAAPNLHGKERLLNEFGGFQSEYTPDPWAGYPAATAFFRKTISCATLHAALPRIGSSPRRMRAWRATEPRSITLRGRSESYAQDGIGFGQGRARICECIFYIVTQ